MMVRFLAMVTAAAIASCSPVPLLAEAEAQKSFPLTVITPPSQCASEGGCIMVGATRIEAALERARSEGGKACKRDGWL